MKLHLNGKPLTLDAPALSVSELLRQLNYPGTHFAVAINYECIPRSEFEKTPVQENDEIEILFPQAGG